MAIFNSLGSNYNYTYALEMLFSASKDSDLKKLENFLEQKYQGKVELYYKGRHALTRALTMLNLQSKDLVAITGFTCLAVYQAVKAANLTPVLIDIDSDLNYSARTFAEKLHQFPNIKAVLIQNTLGYPQEINAIKEICQEHKIHLIEDLAHCIGTQYLDGTEAGLIGGITVLSFSQDKVIDGVSGGAVIVRDVALRFSQQKPHAVSALNYKTTLIDRLYPLATLIIRKSYDIYIGKLLHYMLKKLNLLSKPVDLNQKGLIFLPKQYAHMIINAYNALTVLQEHRRQIANIYRENLNQNLLILKITENIRHSANLRFPILINNRQSLINYLKKNGYHLADIWYDYPIAPKKFKHLLEEYNHCPQSEIITEKIFNLPTHRSITIAGALELCKLVNSWYESEIK